MKTSLIALGLCAALVIHAQNAAPAAATAKIPTIFVCGDSTAKNNANGALGWGTPIAKYIDPAKATVSNVAHAGTSSHSYYDTDWQRVRPQIQAGDYVLIVFGINDGTTPNGLGDEVNATGVHSYGWYMAKMASDTRDKGAHPVFLTVTARNIWTNPKATFNDARITNQQEGYTTTEDKIERGTGGGRYTQWTKDIGTELQIPVVDLTNLEADHYEKLGRETIMVNYLDHNHTYPAGADMVAQYIVAGLKGLKNSPFTAMLSDAGKAIETADAKYITNNDGVPKYRNFVVPLTGQTGNAMPRNPELPTLWVIGDSTVRNGSGFGGANGQWGWGAPMEYFFDADKINVINRALGGTSSRTFYNNNWPAVLANVKKGDFVIMQFGHNDKNGDLTGANAGIGSLNGAGDETQEAAGRGGQPETVHTFGWYLKQMTEQAKAKGATPIICSLIPRKIWEGGKLMRSNEKYFDYTAYAAAAAKAENALYIDLHEITARKYEALGAEKIEPLFVPMPAEWVHTDWYGAIINAESVVGGLKALKDNPLAPYFYGRARDIPAFNPANPLAGTSALDSAASAAKARVAAAAPTQ